MTEETRELLTEQNALDFVKTLRFDERMELTLFAAVINALDYYEDDTPSDEELIMLKNKLNVMWAAFDGENTQRLIDCMVEYKQMKEISWTELCEMDNYELMCELERNTYLTQW